MIQLLSRTTLHGVWPALITPWTDDDRLDEPRFAGEVRSYIGTGVHGVYTGGTTGEFYAQDDSTFDRIAKIACNEAHAGGLPVQIGCTALSSRTVRLRIRTAVNAGADGIQLALPFWLELKDDEVLAFLKDAAMEARPVPLILYHTSRSKRLLTPEFIGQIAADIPTFIGLKSTGSDVPTVRAMLRQAPDLSIFSGDNDLLEKIRAGGRGTYSAVAGLNAGRVVELYNHCTTGRWDLAEPIQDEIHRLHDEVLLPMVRNEGLMDSAIDRVQRTVGGGDVGLRCQRPYRSATSDHVRRLQAWCRQHAPLLVGAAYGRDSCGPDRRFTAE